MRCFDRRVLIGLAAVGVAVVVARPALFGAVVPVLVLLACPLSMLVMMRRSTGSCATGSATQSDDNLESLRAEIACLRAEVKARDASRER